MARPELHSTEDMLDAARQLVLDGGARAASVDGVVGRSGAPKGSIYHRFGSLDDLLAAMWLRAVRRSQERFIAALQVADPVDAAVAAGLAVLDFVTEQPADARLLASMRREDLLGIAVDAGLEKALREVNEPLRAAVTALARRLYGRASPVAVERTLFAVVDLPQGAVRRHLLAGSAPPAALRDQLERAVRGALST